MAVLAKWTLSEMSRSIVSPCAGTHPTLNSTCAEKTTCHAWILFTATPEFDGFIVEKMVEAGAKEIVIAGLPSGTAPPLQDKALVKASLDGLLVVKSRRSSAGRQYIHAKDVDTGIIRPTILTRKRLVSLRCWRSRPLKTVMKSAECFSNTSAVHWHVSQAPAAPSRRAEVAAHAAAVTSSRSVPVKSGHWVVSASKIIRFRNGRFGPL